ncbi:MAG: 3-isopropylmalate dehydratase small subunit [Chloroflexota bacterium]
MEPFTTLHSPVMVLLHENIDTDQIIPARFLKVTDKAGLGDALFAGWRYLPDGSPNPEFVLNQPHAQGCKILLAGDNFGCGSSREHAPWALVAYGFRAVISTSFADIFRNNALKNGLLPVQIDRDAHQAMVECLRCHSHAEYSIDLEHQTLTWPEGHEAHYAIDPFSKTCLLQGVDEMGYLLGHTAEIEAYERSLEHTRAAV